MSDSAAFSLFRPNHCLVPEEPRCVERVFIDGCKMTATAVREQGSSRRGEMTTRISKRSKSTDSKDQEFNRDSKKCHPAGPPLERLNQDSNQVQMHRYANGDNNFVKEQLQRCISEMRVFCNTSRVPFLWTTRCNEFELVNTSCVSRVEMSLLDLPVDFFDSNSIDEANQIPARESLEPIDASDESVAIRCVRRSRIFKTSSSVATESPKGQHGKPRNIFVDDEAICSNAAESVIEDEEMSASMAQFIIDGSNSNNDTSQSQTNDDEMMAFYRKTAHASQDDPMFAQPPKRFAASRKPLDVNPVVDTTDAVDDAEFSGFDWISDIEIP